MAPNICILHVEDNPLDAELVREKLRENNLLAQIDRIDNSKALREALESGGYALILADYSVPGMNMLEAFALARQLRPETPFIFLSGAIGEEVAIEALKMGASDYVFKQNMARLAPAIRRALREAEELSRRRQAEEELLAAKEAAEKANRAKSDFLAIVSHELRTPMTVIFGYLEMLLDGQTTEEQRFMLQAIDTSAGELLTIIDDLLDISHIEARRLKIEEKPFDLRPRVAEVVDLFSVQAREKGLALSWKVAETLPRTLLGDPDRIGQVLLNLVGNAVKFTKRGDISVVVEQNREGIVFSVHDTGIGIPAAALEQIFAPFTQVDSSLTRRFGGIGLGLAISRELVTLMGGKIRARSEVGRGSTFTFHLPLRPAERTPREEAKPPAAARTEPSARILLVEDEPMVRDVLGMLLAKRGWQTEVAENGGEAVSKWQRGAYDLLLMDVQMPGMDGLEATSRIRELEQATGGHTHIIGLTAHAGLGAREQCLAAGMDGYLAKPVRMDELYSTVELCLVG